MQSKVALEAQRRDELAEEVAVLTQKKNRLEAAVERLRTILLPIQRLFSKLSTIRIGANRTALDEVLSDAEMAPSYDAIEALSERA